MKWIIIALMLMCVVAKSQTNAIYHISNSTVIINNVYPSTNSFQPRTNKTVEISREVVERIQWEIMLDQRRIHAFRAYLKSLDKR